MNRTGFDNQANGFWRIMDHEKGHIDVHLVYYEGPGQKHLSPFGSRPIYDGNEMTAYRIRFRLQRIFSSKRVLLYDLSITKEEWSRTMVEKIIE